MNKLNKIVLVSTPGTPPDHFRLFRFAATADAREVKTLSSHGGRFMQHAVNAKEGGLARQ